MVTAADGVPSGHAPRRVILLGASNLVRDLPTVIDTARLVWGGPLDLLAAVGHGRSFGMQSSFLGRSLPGIKGCGLWQALSKRPPAPTAALVADIGNDVLYGASVDQIAGWVQSCLARLTAVATHIVVVPPPVDHLDSLSVWRFLALRSLFFPRSRVDMKAAVDGARELHERVLTLAAGHGALVVSPRREWYGLDPIHIKRHHRSAAWREILVSWSAGELRAAVAGSVARRTSLPRLRPLCRTLFGLRQRRSQPCGTLPDGSTISLY